MSGGYAYEDDEPVENCPYCATPCRADFVDVGVGFTQCGPFHCEQCGASEIGPYDKERLLSPVEMLNGWYAPASDPGSSANVIGGKVVSYAQMNAAYRSEFIGNPLHADAKYVEDWFKKVRL